MLANHHLVLSNSCFLLYIPFCLLSFLGTDSWVWTFWFEEGGCKFVLYRAGYLRVICTPCLQAMELLFS